MKYSPPTMAMGERGLKIMSRGLIMLAELPEKDLDRLEEYLNDLELLLEGLRSRN